MIFSIDVDADMMQTDIQTPINVEADIYAGIADMNAGYMLRGPAAKYTHISSICIYKKNNTCMLASRHEMIRHGLCKDKRNASVHCAVECGILR